MGTILTLLVRARQYQETIVLRIIEQVRLWRSANPSSMSSAQSPTGPSGSRGVAGRDEPVSTTA
jgi:hypothetical protein